MLMQWEKRFSLNHPKIDAQHQHLFHLVEQAYSLPQHTSKTEIKALFVEFFNYMAIHFKDEEAYMKSINYPELEKHKEQHEAIITQMGNILRTSPSIDKIRISLLKESKDWLIEHILIEDLEIKKWHERHKHVIKEEFINLDSIGENEL